MVNTTPFVRFSETLAVAPTVVGWVIESLHVQNSRVSTTRRLERSVTFILKINPFNWLKF